MLSWLYFQHFCKFILMILFSMTVIHQRITEKRMNSKNLSDKASFYLSLCEERETLYVLLYCTEKSLNALHEFCSFHFMLQHRFTSQSVRKSKWAKFQKVDFLLTEHGEPCWVGMKLESVLQVLESLSTAKLGR